MAFLDDAGLVQLWQNITAHLANKVEKVPGKYLSSNDFTDGDKAKLDSLEETTQSIEIDLNDKVDKIAGKGLSTND